MRLEGNTIIITGGATGIGLELAKEFLARNNTVIVCGRRQDKLDEAKSKHAALITIRCDVSQSAERRALFNYCIANHPSVNVLINNAGIQREIDFRKGEAEFYAGDSEIAVNLESTFHLTALFTPHFMKQKESAIVNVSSGLGLVPLAIVPVYSATKAAMHSFSISLRQQLRKTTVKVFEVLPPVVDTDLDKGARDRRGQRDKGISAAMVARETMNGIARDRFEIAVGLVKALRIGSRISPNFFFKMLNKKAPVRD